MSATSLVLWLLVLIPLIQGDIPGTISAKKCYEYLNITAEVPPVTPLTEKEKKIILSDESVNATPVYPYAGGINAKPKEMSFIAALGYEYNGKILYYCGGSLISEEFVITAAHCILSRTWGYVKHVRLGDLNLASSDDDDNAQSFTVAEYHVHPNYSPPIRYNDIALIKLDRPATLNEYVTLICLQSKRSSLRFAFYYSGGWGALGYGEKPSDHLQTGRLYHHHRETCQATFGKDATIPNGIVDDMQICAGSRYKVEDTCEGDSGGPLALLAVYPYRIFYLAGITSFGKPCAIGNISGIYTRVSYYTDWIEKHVWPEAGSMAALYSDKIIFPDY